MKILVVAPHAAIWRHAFPEALIAESLSRSGHEVIYATCAGLFAGYCTAMSAFGLTEADPPQAKAAVCRRCVQAKERIRRLGCRGRDLDQELTLEDRARVEAMLAEVRPESVLDARLLGVEVGRFALYEYLIQRKKRDLAFTPPEWRDYLLALGNAAHAVLAVAQVLERERPDRVLAYNSFYGVHHAALALAETRGVAAYALHAGTNLAHRLDTMILARGSTVRFMRNVIAHWPRLRDIACAPRQLSRVTDHLLELFVGRSVFAYSVATAGKDVDLRQRLGALPGSRILLATMSSYDERFAAQIVGAVPSDEGLLFRSQLEWARTLITLARARPDLHLVLRVHPREFPNKREGAVSQHGLALRAELVDLPANVRVNWPSDGISLYDLAACVDVVLNAWSSAGKEMAMLGIPVVSYAPELLWYPEDLGRCGTTREGYLRAIDEALEEGWSAERMRLAYRWGVLEHARSLIDLADAYRDPESRAPIARRLVRRALRPVISEPDQLLDIAMRPRRLADAATIAAVLERGVDCKLDLELPEEQATLAEESAALRVEARRLAQALFGPRPAESALHRHLLTFADGAGA